ncbi:MAG: hypothetical protein JWR77_1625 [Rhizorhabdus sp.]|nr:hypothetical protein [Rhizorhabdus sp.]
MSEMRFDGAVALVTGAGSGIGRNHALELARRGARVMINDIAVGEDGVPIAERLALELSAEGLQVAANTGSVADEAAAAAMVEETVARFGRIDLLVSNAGGGSARKVQDLPTAEFRKVMELHVFGSFWGTRAALPHMRAQNFGRIVNTSSALGAFGAPNAAAYVTAKAALVGLTRATALDNADCDIRVNALAPVAYTPLAAQYYARVLPHLDTSKLDIANVTPAVLFLLSKECQLSGETIAVGGGRIARIFTAVGPGYRPGTLQAEDIAGNLDTIISTDAFEILRNSEEQYRFL